VAALGKVFLLGAGPGDPELVTVLARRRLAEADLVLYDALVHPDQLAFCKEGAEKVFVGKRAGAPSERQASINERMVAAAREGKIVARLKGGDPYLFGRGSEEAEVLAAEGIPFEVVPGVPSPLAAAAYAGISFTHRDLASSMAWVTATESEAKDRTSHDWSKLATSTQTLVIFMGVRKLESLMALLVEHGRAKETPAAVVQWASTPRQRTVIGTVGDIAERARAAGIGMPALTIVGEVVRLRETLRWFDDRPLFGRRVLLTRATRPSPSGGVARLLRDLGAEPIVAPTIRIVPPDDPAPLRRAVAALGTYDLVAFTSPSAVDALFDALAHDGGDARRFGAAAVYAVGPKTAEALAARGVRPDLVPVEFKGAALAEALVAALPPVAGRRARALLPRSEIAHETLAERLTAAGVEVDAVPAYGNRPPLDADADRLRALLRAGDVDAIGFTSSSTVQNLVDLLGAEARALLDGVVLASIGPSTTATAERLGLTVAVSAKIHTGAGLVDALAEHFLHLEGRANAPRRSELP
jgi:uroporphyrinogen III methyltransferase/synthase